MGTIRILMIVVIAAVLLLTVSFIFVKSIKISKTRKLTTKEKLIMIVSIAVYIIMYTTSMYIYINNGSMFVANLILFVAMIISKIINSEIKKIN